MQFKFFCPMWGIESLGYAEAAKRIKAAGYDGVEAGISPADFREATKIFKDNGLSVILMAFGVGSTPAEMKVNYKKWLEDAASHQPLFINSHTGKDFYTFEQNCEQIRVANEVQKATGVAILHETHRGRFTYSAPAIQHYFVTFPELRLTADFSHWVNVSESLLADQPDNISRAIKRSDHIHSRVGHPEGPQVNDPRAPEWKDCVEAHLGWWDKIVAEQRAKNAAQVTVTSEFGPAPGYLPTLPYTNQPVASQWDINVYMMKLLRERYA